jgi:hypothetical protein
VNERSSDEEGLNSGMRILEHEENDQAPHEELLSDPIFLFYLTSSRVPVAWAMAEPRSPSTLDDDPQVLTMGICLRAWLRLLNCDDVGETELKKPESRLERDLRDNGESDLLLECFVKDGRDSRIECLLKSRTCLGKRQVDSARGDSTKLFVPMDSEVRVAAYDWFWKHWKALGMWQVEWGVSFGSGQRLRISFKRGADSQGISVGRSTPPGRTVRASMIGVSRKEYGFDTGDDEDSETECNSMHWFVGVSPS